MNNKKTVLILVLVFVLVLGGAYVLYQRLGSSVENDILSQPQPSTEQPAAEEEHTPEEVPPEQPQLPAAPDFTAYDADGNAVKLSDYLGKPVVLNFWATWCGVCQTEMPHFNEKYLELGENVQFLMLNATDGYRETVEVASAYLEENGFSFPVLYDTDGDAVGAYRISAFPSTYFIDAEGRGVASAIGYLDAEKLQMGIDLIYSP